MAGILAADVDDRIQTDAQDWCAWNLPFLTMYRPRARWHQMFPVLTEAEIARVSRLALTYEKLNSRELELAIESGALKEICNGDLKSAKR